MDTSVNVIQAFWLVLVTFIVAVIARRAKMPYALALVVAGLIIGVPRLLPRVHLDPQVLLTIFLPPLLFESAINLRVDALRRDWVPISIYTLAGTVASTFIVGLLMWAILHVPLTVSLVFGALISTTDPISVVGVFKRLGANRRLTLLVEAESLFNNDTAVVLFTIMIAAVNGGSLGLGTALLQFVQLAVGGAALGIAIGVIASRVHYELDDHLVEITLTTIVAFGSYLVAGLIHVSGVMAVIAAGIVIGNFGMQRAMSASTQLAMTAFWEYAGFVVNSIVFVLIGIEVCYLDWSKEWHVAIIAAFVVLAGRSAVYPLSVVVNWFGGEISRPWQHVLFWGGLRGALSMALVLGLGPQFPYRETIIAATYGAVLFSLLVQGLSLGPFLRRLGLISTPKPHTSERRWRAAQIIVTKAALAELNRIRAIKSFPTWAVEQVTQKYRLQLAELEAGLDMEPEEYRRTEALHSQRARRAALMAQKSALNEMAREGWLNAQQWLEISRRVDSELVEAITLPVEQPDARHT